MVILTTTHTHKEQFLNYQFLSPSVYSDSINCSQITFINTCFYKSPTAHLFLSNEFDYQFQSAFLQIVIILSTSPFVIKCIGVILVNINIYVSVVGFYIERFAYCKTTYYFNWSTSMSLSLLFCKCKHPQRFFASSMRLVQRD